MAAWWRSTFKRYLLEAHHEKLLTATAEAHDRMTEARAVIKAEGMIYKNRFDEPRAHPAVAIERDSRIAFTRLLRELGLSDDTDAPRPPRPGGRYR